LTNTPYLQTTPEEREEMLAAIGAASIESLYGELVPEAISTGAEKIQFPPPMAEPELLDHLRDLASRNTAVTQIVSFLGGGCYEHFIPAALDAIVGRSEFVTAYTPYQPEASQGTLQAFFEYQTLMARLYAMDVSNASLYDGASALGEAVLLALSVHPERRRVVVPFLLHPHYKAVLHTYLKHLGVEILEIPECNGRTDYDRLRKAAEQEAAAVVVAQPNFFGILEESDEFERAARASDALLIAVADPLSLALVKPPGEYGADIAVGEGQPLGMRPYCGGETLGIFTCRAAYMRRMPGRVVGMTKDRNGKRGFVLTLQTREQHIRREKATSNICTNHAHNALRATVFLSLLGPQGLLRLARLCARNLALFRKKLGEISPSALVHSVPAFRETVIRLKRPARDVCEKMVERGFFAGVPLDIMGPSYEEFLLVSVTDRRKDEEIQSFVNALKDFI